MRTQPVSWVVSRTVSRAVLCAAVAFGATGVACGIAGQSASETVASTSSALVATTVYTTGIGLDGGVLTPGDGAAGPTDPHYELVASNDPAFPAGNLPGPLYVVTPDNATMGQWAPGTSTGEWISPFRNTRASANAYTYRYQTTFSMPGTIANPTKVVMTGTWACDDSCTLLVNGTQVAANTVVGSAETLTIPEGSPFVSGTNTLDFVVDNSGGFETGLLVTSFVPGCTADTQCLTAEFCDTQNGPCTPKLANGQPVPTLTGHTPPLTGVCSGTDVGSAVCATGVCDSADNGCGLANGHGACVENADGGAVSVCRSGACDSDGMCGYKNGDGPCSPDDAGSVAVCRSGVCDTDSKCGLATGDGPCTTGDETTVCRSGVCGASSHVCLGASGDCAVDADCSSGDWCNTGTCVPKLTNGTTVPTVTGHTPPLTGTCTVAVGAAVCASGVCDTSNSECGLVDGKSCTDAGAAVCQTAQCNAGGTCGAGPDAGSEGPDAGSPGPDAGTDAGGAAPDAGSPDAGCTADTACAASQWCDTQSGACVPKLGNGVTVPTVTGHTPALTGTCTAAVGTAVCASGVCDPSNSECGLVDGKSCADAGAAVCQSAQCNAGGTCGAPLDAGGMVLDAGAASPDAGCAFDTDCAASQWCDTQSGACVPKLGNGVPVPAVTGHNPGLTGVCTAAVGTAVCASGVCDTTNNDCGLVDGKSCVNGGAAVCQSAQCNSAGTCGALPDAGCAVDTDCATSQWCDTQSGACVPKLSNGVPVPTVTGHSPGLTGVCTMAVGAAVCASGVCDVSDNACGYIDGDGPCTPGDASVSGVSVCRTGICNAGGVCGPPVGCQVDAQCSASQWCNTATGVCSAKLPNGTGVPTVGGHTPALDGQCTTAAGASVCASGVCDPADNACGLAKGDGPCTIAQGPMVCRTGTCLAELDVCGDAFLPTGGVACSVARAGQPDASFPGWPIAATVVAMAAAAMRRRRRGAGRRPIASVQSN
jgi:hypothetical protein